MGKTEGEGDQEETRSAPMTACIAGVLYRGLLHCVQTVLACARTRPIRFSLGTSSSSDPYGRHSVGLRNINLSFRSDHDEHARRICLRPLAGVHECESLAHKEVRFA